MPTTQSPADNQQIYPESTEGPTTTNQLLEDFIDAFFLDYLASRLPEATRDQQLKVWHQLPTVEEQQAYLETIEPNFMATFRHALESELQRLTF